MSVTRYTILETVWGAFAYLSSEERLLRTFLPRSRAELTKLVRSISGAAEDRTALPQSRRQVLDYFQGRPVAFDVDVDLSGVPPFRRRILEACRRIPYGRTATYSDLARAAGKGAAVRAAGSAMAHNPLPLVVPCHRVLRADGTIGGFSSTRGVDEKIRLLQLEGIRLLDGLASRLRRAV